MTEKKKRARRDKSLEGVVRDIIAQSNSTKELRSLLNEAGFNGDTATIVPKSQSGEKFRADVRVRTFDGEYFVAV